MRRKVFAKGSTEEQSRSKECKEKSLQKAAQRSGAGRKNAKKSLCKRQYRGAEQVERMLRKIFAKASDRCIISVVVSHKLLKRESTIMLSVC